MIVIKKYANRRLYDTEASRYITLDELAERIRSGANVRIVDAATDADLTQQTLAQILLESRGAAHLLPVPLLLQLVRLRDDALAEFFGRYVSWALEVYVKAREAAQSVAQYNPLLNLVLGQQGFGRPGGGFPGFGGHGFEGFGGPFGQAPGHGRGGPGAGAPGSGWAEPGPPPPAAASWPEPPAPPAPGPSAGNDDLSALRRELEELRRAVGRADDAPKGVRKGSKPAAAAKPGKAPATPASRARKPRKNQEQLPETD